MEYSDSFPTNDQWEEYEAEFPGYTRPMKERHIPVELDRQKLWEWCMWKVTDYAGQTMARHKYGQIMRHIRLTGEVPARFMK